MKFTKSHSRKIEELSDKELSGLKEAYYRKLEDERQTTLHQRFLCMDEWIEKQKEWKVDNRVSIDLSRGKGAISITHRDHRGWSQLVLRISRAHFVYYNPVPKEAENDWMFPKPANELAKKLLKFAKNKKILGFDKKHKQFYLRDSIPLPPISLDEFKKILKEKKGIILDNPNTE